MDNFFKQGALMKILICFLFFILSHEGRASWAWGGEDSFKEPTSVASPSYLAGTIINSVFNWRADPEAERKKFPHITLHTLQGWINFQDSAGDIEQLRYPEIEYKSEMGGLIYDGIATIEGSIDIGKVRHHFLGPERGFDLSFTYEPYKVGLGDFLSRWIQDGYNEALIKGNPYKGGDSKTRVKYMGYNNGTNEYISFIVRRHKKPIAPS